MAKGNFVVFKGPTKKGKTSVAFSTIKQFLNESSKSRAIYVGLTQNAGELMLNALPEDLRSRALAIGVDNSGSSDADVILSPHAAL